MSNEEKQINTQAVILFHAIQIKSLEEVLAMVCKAAGAKFDGKTFQDFLREKRDTALQHALLHLANDDVSYASKVSAILNEMHRSY